MSIRTVLITGGAGFIGTHVADQLIEHGYEVIIFDRLLEQVHSSSSPAYLPKSAKLITGDIRDRQALDAALENVDAVIHLASEVGVGQSMYEIERYVDTNTRGMAILLELIVARKDRIKRLIVASSMSSYGEGSYECNIHGILSPLPRSNEQLKNHDWELRCPTCDQSLRPVPTKEDRGLNPGSIYAISKMDQELMALSVGRYYNIGTVALRFFNTYGPRQALSNPYTGLAAIFSTQLLNGRSPQVYEDGAQARDFIHVYDTAASVVKALEAEHVVDAVCNIGTGKPVTVLEVAKELNDALGFDIQPSITNNYRAGDIRHCWADVSRARELIGFEAKIDFKDGIKELVEWVKNQEALDNSAQAQEELKSRGLAG